MIIITHPPSWNLADGSSLSVVSDKLDASPLAPINESDVGGLLSYELRDVKLVQKSAIKQEPAWIFIESEDHVKPLMMSNLIIESNARFVEVYAVDKYLTTLKGEAVPCSDNSTKCFYFSVQLQQQISFHQLRLKFLSIKDIPGSVLVAEAVASEGAKVLHLLKLRLSIIETRDGPDRLCLNRDVAFNSSGMNALHDISKGVMLGALSGKGLELFETKTNMGESSGAQQERSTAPSLAKQSSNYYAGNSNTMSSTSLLPDLLMMKEMLLRDVEGLLDRKLAPLYSHLDALQLRLDDALAVMGRKGKEEAEDCEVSQQVGIEAQHDCSSSSKSRNDLVLNTVHNGGLLQEPFHEVTLPAECLSAVPVSDFRVYPQKGFDERASLNTVQDRPACTMIIEGTVVSVSDMVMDVTSAGAEDTTELALKADMRDLMKLLRGTAL